MVEQLQTVGNIKTVLLCDSDLKLKLLHLCSKNKQG